MKRVSLTFLAVLLLLPVSSILAEGDPVASPWKMRVKMVMSDTCGINCPCLFGLDPHGGHCRFLGGMHIVEGNYGDVSLDGVDWAVFGEFTGSGENQKWLYSAYYISKKSTKAQRKALRAILSSPPFSTLGMQMGIKVERVTIELPDSPVGVHRLTLGKLGSVEVRPARGNDPNTPQTLDNPVYPFPVPKLSLGQAEGRFSDHGKDLDFMGENNGSGEIGEFLLSGGGA